jgi:hypothetical protein
VKLPSILSKGFLEALPAEERKRLGKAGMTQKEAEAVFTAGQEKELQLVCARWLDLNGIYFESDRMDKRSSGKCGRADFRICHRGLWLSAETKVSGQSLRDEQAVQAERLRKSGGKFVVVYALDDLIQAVRSLEKGS